MRSWHGVWVLAAFGSPAFAAPVHARDAAPARAIVASASGAFDHVPVAAERIAASFGVVTSTFRSVAHNREVGGVPNSWHLQGRAIDVARRPGIKHAQIAAALRSAGFLLIESLDEGNHSHFAFGPVLVHPAVAAPPEALQELAKPAIPRLAADEHGSLLVDAASEGRR